MKTLVIFYSMLFLVMSSFAQTTSKAELTDEEINELSSNLAMKLLFNESQTSDIENLLKTYRSDLAQVMGSSVKESQNKIMSATNEKIVALLDSKQKMKFNVIGADWWKSIQEAAGN